MKEHGTKITVMLSFEPDPAEGRAAGKPARGQERVEAFPGISTKSAVLVQGGVLQGVWRENLALVYFALFREGKQGFSSYLPEARVT